MVIKYQKNQISDELADTDEYYGDEFAEIPEDQRPFYQRGVFRVSSQTEIAEPVADSAPLSRSQEVVKAEVSELLEGLSTTENIQNPDVSLSDNADFFLEEELDTAKIHEMDLRKAHYESMLKQGRIEMASGDFEVAAMLFREASDEGFPEGTFYLGLIRIYDLLLSKKLITDPQYSRHVFTDLRQMVDAVHRYTDPQMIFKLMEVLDKLFSLGLLDNKQFEKECDLEKFHKTLAFCRSDNIKSRVAFSYLRGMTKQFVEGKQFRLFEQIYNKKIAYENQQERN
jgi:hypothetical protein